MRDRSEQASDHSTEKNRTEPSRPAGREADRQVSAAGAGARKNLAAAVKCRTKDNSQNNDRQTDRQTHDTYSVYHTGGGRDYQKNKVQRAAK